MLLGYSHYYKNLRKLNLVDFLDPPFQLASCICDFGTIGAWIIE